VKRGKLEGLPSIRNGVRWVARFILGCIALGSLTISAWHLFQFWHDPLVRLTVERSVEEIRERLESELTRGATPEAMAARLRELLAEQPRDWSRIDAITELAEARQAPLPDDVVAEVEAARGEDHSALELTKACAVCAWDYDNCSLSNVFVCRVPLDLTPVGDIGSILRELWHMAAGQEVDQIDLVLSTFGVGAVVIAPVVGGTSLSLKLGAGAAKAAYRMGSLSGPIVAEGRRLGARAVDWDLLRHSRPGRFLDVLPRALRKDAAEPIVGFLRDVEEMRGAIGARQTRFVLRQVDSAEEARRMTAVAKAAKTKTAGSLEMLGKRRLLRLAARWSDEAYALLKAITGLLIALVMLFFSMLKAVLLRLLRRAARERPRAPA